MLPLRRVEVAWEESKVLPLATRQPCFLHSLRFWATRVGQCLSPVPVPLLRLPAALQGQQGAGCWYGNRSLTTTRFTEGHRQPSDVDNAEWLPTLFLVSADIKLEPCQFAPVESLSRNGGYYPDFYSGAEKVAAAVLRVPDFNLGCLGLLVLPLEKRVRRTSLCALRQSFFLPFYFVWRDIAQAHHGMKAIKL